MTCVSQEKDTEEESPDNYMVNLSKLWRILVILMTKQKLDGLEFFMIFFVFFHKKITAHI